MGDDLFRIRRVLLAISECIGVFGALELNYAETAYVVRSIEEGLAIVVKREESEK